MDRIGDYISEILNTVNISRARKTQLEEEIRDHLCMAKKELIINGYSEEEAELKAVQEFGDPQEIAKSLRQVFSPLGRFKNIFEGKKIMTEAVQWALMIIAALIISLSVRSYAFAQTQVRQDSMQNTLYAGQKLIEFKAGYYLSSPKRGDIVIINREEKKGAVNLFIDNTKEFFESFYKNNDNDKKRLIKRVIGVPGDQVDIADGKVYINGSIYNESYAKGITLPNTMQFPVTVPQNEYFVMGDNREVSLDSRDLGFFSINNIEGKAVFRLWPFEKFGGIYK